MDKKITVNIGGIVPALLGVAFIILKLCKVIAWSWIWVVAPFWIPLALGLVMFIIAILLAKIINS